MITFAATEDRHDMENGKYLDPKADLTFKKVFGEHEDLVMSLLNALLPLDEGKQIEHVEYMQPEMVPENPGKKNSIVNVRCRETGGRHFIVEMQMNWNHEFYHYAIVNVAHTDRIIEGLRFVFVELPKFKPQTIKERKMAVLWLRFLTEINKGTREAPKELLENPETSKALKILEKSAYSEEDLYAYERYWDYVNYERGIVEGGNKGKHLFRSLTGNFISVNTTKTATLCPQATTVPPLSMKFSLGWNQAYGASLASFTSQW